MIEQNSDVSFTLKLKNYSKKREAYGDWLPDILKKILRKNKLKILMKSSIYFKFKKYILIFLLTISCQSSENIYMSGEINEFPSIEGNNLNKEKKIVPDDFVDKDLIIIVAFQQWHQGLVDQSINLLEGNDMDSTHNIIEVPTIRKTNKLNELYLDGVMRAGIRDDRIRNRTITAYLDKEAFKNDLDIPNEDTIYWFLIEEGSSNIILQGVGVITEQELDLIRSN